MRIAVYILSLMILVSTEVVAQGDYGTHPISFFMDDANAEHEMNEKYSFILEKLKVKQEKSRSESHFINQVFKYVHTKQLGRYEDFVSLPQTLGDKKLYNCVTGTALYALILEDLGFDYTIKEFQYHALLIVHTPELDILLESTDPLGGFVTDQKEINKRVTYYTKEAAFDQIDTPVGNRQENVGIHKDISLKELAGLQLFNKALYHFNNSELEQALMYINKAHALYPSERIENMRLFINQFITKSSLAAK